MERPNTGKRLFMRTIRSSINSETSMQSGKAVVTVTATTALLLIIGRDTLGVAVIALLLLVPVGWSTTRWGVGAGSVAAVAAALAFNFFFIPPYYTFTIGSLEGWLVFAIFTAVAVVMVDRINSGLVRAQASERDAIFMYELSAALAGARTQSAVAHIVARQLRQMFQAPLVRVVVQVEGQPPSVVATEPVDRTSDGPADRVIPILNDWGLVGSIQIWRGTVPLPSPDVRLLQNFASQAGQALERTRLAEAETQQRDRGIHLNAPIRPN
jgi:two-component system sensor histidine kinase KdpD